MADDIDQANDLAQHERDKLVAAARKAASDIPPGEPGDCDFCGEWSGRLVGGACAGCRDRLRLP